MYVLTVGTFDGVHKGHNYILNNTLEEAKKDNLIPLVIMLRYPIGQYVNGFDGLILPSWKRKSLMEKMGFKVKIVDMEDVWKITHEEYLNDLINLGVKKIVCGEDFRFGRGALGDVSYLLTEGVKKGLKIKVLHDLKNNGKRISSTLIRKSLKKGLIEKANFMLNRHWTLEGPIYEDRHVGRDRLGFPTANMDIRYKEDILFPAYGVYISKSLLNEKIVYGLTSVGIRPTYYEKKKEPKVETFYMDFDDNLYDQIIEIKILKFLRSEIKFNSEKDLILQMKKDEILARNIILKEKL